ncbi:tRNA preQ1(34) S-adenosylmethionine ribosyltransferase-isomerase QueA [bacterium]
MGQNIGLKLSDYDFLLPDELIAQHPLKSRDHSKLLIYDTAKERIIHKKFYNIVSYFNQHDVLVLNKSKVMPVKLFGIKENSGGKVDVVLVDEIETGLNRISFSVLTRFNKLKNCKNLIFFDNTKAEIKERIKDTVMITFHCSKKTFYKNLEKYGHAPLPPYIKRNSKTHIDPLHDRSSYQTVYAEDKGSIAAPTAGLHFTENLMYKIKDNGAHIALVTLHVGAGTFAKIKHERIAKHNMLPEYYVINKSTKAMIDKCKKGVYNLTSVGTTSTRTIESYFCDGVTNGNTDLFIYPGHEFFIDRLITNFHVPKSTPLVLTAAFIADKRKKMGDNDSIKNAFGILRKIYMEAIEKKYRFYSYGDAMFII